MSDIIAGGWVGGKKRNGHGVYSPFAMPDIREEESCRVSHYTFADTPGAISSQEIYIVMNTRAIKYDTIKNILNDMTSAGEHQQSEAMMMIGKESGIIR